MVAPSDERLQRLKADMVLFAGTSLTLSKPRLMSLLII